MTEFEIILSEEARADLKGINDQRSRKAIAAKIDELRLEPNKRGKSLGEALSGLRSVRAAGQRYRVLYRVMLLETQVVVVVVGLRRAGSKDDVYKLAEKRLRGKGEQDA